MTERIDARAEDHARALRGARAQRMALAGGAVAYLVLAITVSPPPSAAWALPGVIGAALFALALIPARDARYPALIIPVASALLFGVGLIATTLADPTPDAFRFALLCGLFVPFISILAPTRRGALAALMAIGLVLAAGVLLVAAKAPTFDALTAVTFLLAAFALALMLARAFEAARSEAFALRTELERRATSDEITGVSNRAHITLLAQNEFARARRYGEPYSCLVIEIEDFEKLLAAHGQAAHAAIVQVFTGYCVVVMRHCDSFGRLTPSRFLALLPETPAAGARTLAERMCRDLAALEVAFGGAKLRFAASIGATEMHAVDRSAGDMLRRAEQGLADALERGGACAVFATPPATPASAEPAAELTAQAQATTRPKPAAP